jgi:RNA polymerase sigma-70 factor (ECF subfamily)
VTVLLVVNDDMNDPEELSDVNLATLINQGDELAFNELYRRYWTQMYIYLRKFVPDKEQCEDTVQEVFLSIWKNGFPPQQTLISSYLYAAVRFKIFDYFDKNKVISKYEASFKAHLDRNDLTPERTLIQKELNQLIEREILALPSKMRRVFLLSREDNLSQKEIAAILQISDKTVKKQMSNAMKILWIKLSTASLICILLFL